jgi:hypothetical protein
LPSPACGVAQKLPLEGRRCSSVAKFILIICEALSSMFSIRKKNKKRKEKKEGREKNKGGREERKEGKEREKKRVKQRIKRQRKEGRKGERKKKRKRKKERGKEKREITPIHVDRKRGQYFCPSSINSFPCELQLCAVCR